MSTLKHRAHRQQVSLHRWIGARTFFRRHPVQAASRIGRREVRRARVWIRVIRRELAETHDALIESSRHLVGHLAGWLCIHAREGAWNAQTGNGFFGGLQMTYGWAGRVTNAALLSPEQQIAAAEAEAREHGWAYSWMASQWPNTFPPCAGLFA